MTPPKKPKITAQSGKVRSLPLDRWPAADRAAWAAACRPSERLKRGGTASHMKDITRRDLVRRYGYFLDHVQRSEGLDPNAAAAGYVSPDRVDRFLAELKGRVRSVTVHGSTYKLCRIAQILDPARNFTWLIKIEEDLALGMQPKSKFGRLVYANVLIDAGVMLMAEADATPHRSALARARQFRNGLMVAMLAFHPVRPGNFAALEIGRSFKQVNGSWWIVLSHSETKEKRLDERAIDSFLAHWIDRYLGVHRPILARTDEAVARLWLSSNDGRAMTYDAVERAISKTTLATVGIAVSPHLFRTAGASTAALHAGSNPNLGSALLHHRDPTVTAEHYNRASSLEAAKSYGALIRALRKRKDPRAPERH